MQASEHQVRELEARLARLCEGAERLRRGVGQRFLGQTEVVEQILLCVFAGGHALIEGAPGLGKTTLVRALARSLDLSFQRLQFTPDLMPGDILGTRILEEDPEGRRSFRFHRGPVFANLLLADEINRATPRTQAALLEAMQEGQVSTHGETLRLEQPFAVMATQNPIEMEGTYPLPEAQLDRFLARIEVRMPGESELVEILAAATGPEPGPLEPCLSRAEVLEMRALVRAVPASSEVVAFVARLVLATDPASERACEPARALLRYGASPRGGQSVLLLAKARALLGGRLHVSEEDVAAVARPALRHRLVPSYEGEASGMHPDEIVTAALAAAGA